MLQLEDSLEPVGPDANEADYLVGSLDLRTVIEELWTAGAEAIAINGEHICAIGTNATVRALATTHTEQIDLAGQLVLPGLCDAHIHLHEWSINLPRPRLAAARSKSEMLTMIRQYTALLPATTWVVFQGWKAISSATRSRWDAVP